MARNIAPQDISWFLDLNERGRLNLSPPYQRHSVWTTRERRYFLDTIFNGYPCPPVFLYKSISDAGVATYHVVDGKQRLETVINFASNKIALSDDILDERLRGKRWKQIDVEYKKEFWNYQFAVEMLDSVDNATVKEIFDRYNRTSKNLERQELRHAKYDGWFVTTAEEEARKDEWRSLGIGTAANARRMRDVQFVSELMIVTLTGEIQGFDQDALDDVYAKYDAPVETDPTFSEEEFVTHFEAAKRWILDVQAVNGVIVEMGKSSTNFYTLWTLATLHADRLPEPAAFAEAYRAFMTRVTELLKTENPDLLLAGQDAELYRDPYAYAQNAKGAVTEFPLRKQRHEILERALLGVPQVNDEDN
jgi:hypothetical protein